MDKRYQLVLGFLALGFFFLALSFYYSKNSSSGPEFGIKLGTLSRETGQVTLIRSQLSQNIKVEKKIDVGNFDTIETKDLGEALLILENGGRLRIFGNSLLTIERVESLENENLVILIKRGDLRVDQPGREGELFISKNGERIDSSLYNESELKRKLVATSFDDTSTQSESVKSLTEEEISSTLNHQKNSFFKCYTHLLQKNPQSKGEVTMNFTIENNGKISFIEITTAMNDEHFKKCLKEVLSRVEFKSFKGSPISTVFPLVFN